MLASKFTYLEKVGTNMHIWLKNMVTLFDHVSKWKLTYSNTFLDPYFRFYIANIFKNRVREKSMSNSTLCYGTWKSWYHVVVSDGLVERCTLCSTLCATWKLEHYVMHNVKKRKPLTLRREYMNTFCHIVLAKLLTYCLQKRMFHHYAAMFKIYLILIFTSDELPLLIY